MNALVEFKELHRKGKTKRLAVFSKWTGRRIGCIKWHRDWRRYNFFPSRESFFDAGCLGVIRRQLQSLMAERAATGGGQ